MALRIMAAVREGEYDPERLTSPDFNLRVGAFYLKKVYKMKQILISLQLLANFSKQAMTAAS